MGSKTDILQHLIHSCFFAPNSSRLAALLGKQGRMNLRRLQAGALGERGVETLWHDIIETMSVPEAWMPYLPVVWELSSVMKQSSDAIEINLSPEEQYRPASISAEQWQQIINLYREDSSLYFMLLSLVYARRRNINPYAERQMRACCTVVEDIDATLHQLYPQQINAHEAAQELQRVIRAYNADSWWWIGFYGGTILRLYYEPQHIEEILGKYSYAMPFLDWQWWRRADSNAANDTLWYWQKNGGTSSIYEVLRLLTDVEAEQAVHFRVVFLNEKAIRLYYNDIGYSLHYELEQHANVCTLHFSFDDEEIRWLLPEHLVMLTDEDNEQLHKRAIDSTAFMQRETVRRIYQESGLRPTADYEVVDVECGRRTVRIVYQRLDTQELLTAEYALTDYPALRSVTAHTQVKLFSNEAGKLYALCENLGLMIELL